MSRGRLLCLLSAGLVTLISGVCTARSARDPAAATSTPHRAASPDRPLASLLPAGFSRADIGIRVEKHAYRLTVLYRGKPVKSYPVVLGGDPVDDKLREGDGCTPEGRFHVAFAHRRPDWTCSMVLDYPTADSRRKYVAAIRRRQIPRTAAIGSAIAIHGVPVGHDDLVESGTNWTAGCISLRSADVDEIYRVARPGTVVEIVH